MSCQYSYMEQPIAQTVIDLNSSFSVKTENISYNEHIYHSYQGS